MLSIWSGMQAQISKPNPKFNIKFKVVLFCCLFFQIFISYAHKNFFIDKWIFHQTISSDIILHNQYEQNKT